VLFSHDTKADALGRCTLFQGLSKDERKELAKVTEDLEVDAGKVLCREGETASEFFVIVEGEADVTKDGKHLRTLSDSEFFGEIALLEDMRRTATVTAKTPLRFFVLTRQSFWSLLERQPDVERKVLRELAKRVLATSDDPTIAAARS
jgi:CRP/FNR family transcriptional regulator, cyclic AMP receptor protein